MKFFFSFAGVGGNLAAIQASHLATFYHQHCRFGALRETLSSHLSFKRAFFSNCKRFLADFCFRKNICSDLSLKYYNLQLLSIFLILFS